MIPKYYPGSRLPVYNIHAFMRAALGTRIILIGTLYSILARFYDSLSEGHGDVIDLFALFWYLTDLAVPLGLVALIVFLVLFILSWVATIRFLRIASRMSVTLAAVARDSRSYSSFLGWGIFTRWVIGPIVMFLVMPLGYGYGAFQLFLPAIALVASNIPTVIFYLRNTQNLRKIRARFGLPRLRIITWAFHIAWVGLVGWSFLWFVVGFAFLILLPISELVWLLAYNKTAKDLGTLRQAVTSRPS